MPTVGEGEGASGGTKLGASGGEECAGGACSTGNGCFVAGTLVATPSGQIAIEDVALGDRVLPDDASCHVELEEPTVRLDFASTDQNGNPVAMSLLRSAAWVAAAGLALGQGSVVDLPEMGITTRAFLQHVSVVAPSPAAVGCLVTGLFRRWSEETVRVDLAGASSLVATFNHPLRSETRGTWIAAGELVSGEILRDAAGGPRVLQVDRSSRPPACCPRFAALCLFGKQRVAGSNMRPGDFSARRRMCSLIFRPGRCRA